MSLLDKATLKCKKKLLRVLQSRNIPVKTLYYIFYCPYTLQLGMRCIEFIHYESKAQHKEFESKASGPKESDGPSGNDKRSIQVGLSVCLLKNDHGLSHAIDLFPDRDWIIILSCGTAVEPSRYKTILDEFGCTRKTNSLGGPNGPDGQLIDISEFRDVDPNCRSWLVNQRTQVNRLKPFSGPVYKAFTNYFLFTHYDALAANAYLTRYYSKKFGVPSQSSPTVNLVGYTVCFGSLQLFRLNHFLNRQSSSALCERSMAGEPFGRSKLTNLTKFSNLIIISPWTDMQTVVEKFSGSWTLWTKLNKRDQVPTKFEKVLQSNSFTWLRKFLRWIASRVFNLKFQQISVLPFVQTLQNSKLNNPNSKNLDPKDLDARILFVQGTRDPLLDMDKFQCLIDTCKQNNMQVDTLFGPWKHNSFYLHPDNIKLFKNTVESFLG